MSNIIIIYDKSGTSRVCITAPQKIITELADTSRSTVLRLSEKHLDESNPNSLFVIPGGSYLSRNNLKNQEFGKEGPQDQIIRTFLNYLAINLKT